MSFHSYMETFAEAWVAANTQTAVNLQLHPRPIEARPLRPSELEEHELPTMLSKEQLAEDQAPLALTRQTGTMSPDVGQMGLSRPNSQQDTNSQQLSSPPPVMVNSVPPSPCPSAHFAVDTKTVAVHCVIEPSVTQEGDPASLRKDTYVVIPGSTPFREVVPVVLLKIGYSHGDAMGAKGNITVKQWHPLSFETICKDPDATVDQILGELTNVATLSIKLFCYSPEHDNVEWNDQTVRCAVNELLKEMNQCKLAKLSPLSQSTISNIANSKYLARIGPEKCREFGAWYRMLRQTQLNNPDCEDIEVGARDTRLTFHPLFELPRMRDWYRACKNPSDQVLRRFLDELNEGHVRQQRQKVTLSKLKIWWKNEKQREKRLQQKQERQGTEVSQQQQQPQQQQQQQQQQPSQHQEHQHSQQHQQQQHQHRQQHRQTQQTHQHRSGEGVVSDNGRESQRSLLCLGPSYRDVSSSQNHQTPTLADIRRNPMLTPQ